jgi:hypothetical protein
MQPSFPSPWSSERRNTNAAAARAIAEFVRTSGRFVEEVMEWFTDKNGIGAQPRCINPPYRIGHTPECCSAHRPQPV